MKCPKCGKALDKTALANMKLQCPNCGFPSNPMRTHK